MTDLICTLVTGSNIRSDTVVDQDGFTCEQRQAQEKLKTRLLQDAEDSAADDAAGDDAAAEGDDTTPFLPAEDLPDKFDMTYTFYVNSNDLVIDDDTITKVKEYLKSDGEAYKTAIDLLLHDKDNFPNGWPNSTVVTFGNT